MNSTNLKPSLEKEALWQVHMPSPKKIDHPHYNVTTPNDLLYVSHNNVFERSTCNYILTIDVASRYKVAKALETKKTGKVAFVLKVIHKKGGAFKYPEVIYCDIGSEFKNNVARLLEKHDLDIRRTINKYKHTHTVFAEAFNKELEKQLFKSMDAQELQDPGKVATIWVKNMNPIVKKIISTKSSMTGIKPKDGTV